VKELHNFELACLKMKKKKKERKTVKFQLFNSACAPLQHCCYNPRGLDVHNTPTSDPWTTWLCK